MILKLAGSYRWHFHNGILAGDFKARNREFSIGQNVEFIYVFLVKRFSKIHKIVSSIFASDEYNSSHVHDIHVYN